MKIIHIIGARPNFMKAAPVIRALDAYAEIEQTSVHTGQHYDTAMSQIFFEQLELPRPDVNLEVGSGSHAIQTAQVMIRFEEYVQDKRPDWVLVYGDINSTVAAALVSAKMMIPVAHIEAGLRSFDLSMPEEINRIVTDRLASLLFTPSMDGNENLLREGVTGDKIHMVGNVMIDTLIRMLPKAEAQWERLSSTLDIQGEYGLVTLHRPSNVDEVDVLFDLIKALNAISQDLPLIFPVHPRTRVRMENQGLNLSATQLRFVEPLGYLEFLALQKRAAVVITDSGGIQEETTFLDVPCLTLRSNTERPVTVTSGTNRLIGSNMEELRRAVGQVLNGERKQGLIPPLWDGKAGERIARILAKAA